jgi:hypothetical protein
MIDLTAENIFVCLTILLSTLLLYGFWKLINEALPGDQEIMAYLNRARAMKAQIDQQSRQTTAEIAGLAVQNHRMRKGDVNENEIVFDEGKIPKKPANRRTSLEYLSLDT